MKKLLLLLTFALLSNVGIAQTRQAGAVAAANNDFWRSGAGATTPPDGAVDLTEAIRRNGAVGLNADPSTTLHVNSAAAGDTGLRLEQTRQSVTQATGIDTVAVGVDTTGKVRVTNALGSADNRAVDSPPQAYQAGSYNEFKQSASIGMAAIVPAVSGYVGLQTFRRYGYNTDYSGGPARQEATTDDGRTYYRMSTSATTWGAWTNLTPPTTEWVLSSTNADAGADKTSAISRTGAVGIGVLAPAELLHLRGAAANSPNILLDGIGGGGSVQALKIRPWSGMPANTYAGFGGVDDGAASARAAIFVPNAANTGVKEAVSVLKGTGNVGVGTATPTYRLDLAQGTFGFGTANVRTETRNDAGLQGNAGAQSGMFETSAPAPASSWPVGASGWQHLLDVRHSNNGNNYAMQFAGSFFDQWFFGRKTNGNAAAAWQIFLMQYANGDIPLKIAPRNYASVAAANTDATLAAGTIYTVTAGGGKALYIK